MKRSKRMALVLQLAEKAESSAAQALQAHKQLMSESDAQLRQVLDYQEEYVAQLNAKKAPKNAAEMLNDRQFLQQLSEAEVNQRQRNAQLEQQLGVFLTQWQQLYQRRKNVAQMIDRLVQSEDQASEKLLQKEMDELASLARRTQ